MRLDGFGPHAAVNAVHSRVRAGLLVRTWGRDGVYRLLHCRVSAIPLLPTGCWTFLTISLQV